MKNIKIVKLVIAIAVCLAAGAIGSIFTAESVGTWFKEINKPSFSPPNWVFAPVWTALYILMGVSAYIIWMKGWGKKEVRGALTIFGMQLALNTLWSFLFFGMRNPFYGFIEIIFLWLAIAATIIRFNKLSRNAALLLVPYLLWVSFAAYLTYSIWQLN